MTELPRARTSLTTNASWETALTEVLDACLEPEGPPPDVLLIFACPMFADAFPALLRASRQRARAGVQMGCCVSGMLAGDVEVEDQPGLAVMALWLPGATLYPVRLHQEHLALLGDEHAWRDVYGVPSGAVRSWLMLAEPFRIDTQELIRALGLYDPHAPIMGGIASGLVGERQSRVFLDDQVYDEGGVALGIGGPYVLEPMVSQGCDPIGETWTITGTDRNHVLSISNRPALEVLQNTLATLPPGQREQAQRNLLIGLAANEYQDAYERGDFLIRGILGIDPRRGSIAVGGMPRTGQTIQFQLRSAEVATLDLSRALADVGAKGIGDVVAAVLCTCDGRGKALFGTSHHDAAMVQAALPGIPVAGAFCLGEIGPMGSQTALHGFTATLGVLRQRKPDKWEEISY